jgi:hypothetical protein
MDTTNAYGNRFGLGRSKRSAERLVTQDDASRAFFEQRRRMEADCSREGSSRRRIEDVSPNKEL